MPLSVPVTPRETIFLPPAEVFLASLETIHKYLRVSSAGNDLGPNMTLQSPGRSFLCLSHPSLYSDFRGFCLSKCTWLLGVAESGGGWLAKGLPGSICAPHTFRWLWQPWLTALTQSQGTSQEGPQCAKLEAFQPLWKGVLWGRAWSWAWAMCAL